MKNNHRSERGQAIVLITLAIVGLVAMTGLAIDGGFAFSDRRHAQNAADTAALAGALARVHPPVSTDLITADLQAEAAAFDLAELNGFASDLLTSEVFFRIPPEEPGPYQGNNDYVEVVIESYRDTYFAKVIGVDKMFNRVSAVAKATPLIQESLYGGNTVVALKPTSGDCSGEFTFGGSGETILEGGGIFVNSDGTCAFQQSGCNATMETDTGDSVPVSIVGDYVLESCDPPLDATFTTVDKVVWPDDVILLEEPSACSETPDDYTYDPITNTVTVYPGFYTQLPPIGATKDGDNIKLDPGVYCVSKVLKLNKGILEGHDIFLYIQETGDFDLTGGTNILSATTPSDDPPEPENDPYYTGYLIYVAPDFASNVPATCKLAGNQDSSFIGTIYAPYCNITITGSTGTSDGIRSQIIGYEVTLLGDAVIKIIYNGDENGRNVQPAEVGLSQ